MDQQPPVPPMPITPSSQPAAVTPPPTDSTTPVASPLAGNQPMQPPTPTAGSQTPAQLPPHNSKKVMMIIIAIVIVIAIGIAVYFLLFNKPAPGAKTAIPTITKSVPTPTPDPTANWKTYTNPFYSFKYPETLTIMTEPAKSIYDVRLQNDDYNISFQTINFGSGMTLEKLVKPKLYSIEQTKTLVTKDGLTVDGKPAYRGEGQIQIPGVKMVYSIVEGILVEDNKYLEVIANASPNMPAAELTKVLDEILATLQFTSSTPSAAPSTSQSSPSGATKLTQ